MLSLFVSVCILGIILYLPGYLALRAFGFCGCISIVFAPVVSCFTTVIAGVVLRGLGIFASWYLVLAPLFAISIVSACVWAICRHRLQVSKNSSGNLIEESLLGNDLNLDKNHLLVALAINAIIGAGVFLLALDGPDSFPQGFDVGHHLSHVQAVIQYGNFSTLNVDLYGTGQGGFYPSLFHILAALPVGMLEVPTSLAMNAVILLLIMLVYPLGMYFLGQLVLPNYRYSGLCFVVLSLCFAGFPWALLRYCTLLPNICAMAFLPLVVTCFIFLVELDASVWQRVKLSLLLLLCIFVLAIAHPNGVFSAIVFLYPYCISRILKTCNVLFANSRRRRVVKFVLAILFSLATIAFWLVCFNLPSFHSVVTYDYKEMLNAPSAVLGAVIQQMRGFAPNVPLAILVLAGLVFSTKEKGIRWLLFPYALSALMLILCGCLSSCQLKFLLCGFWYNHDYRIMALFAFCSLPLAGLGLSSLLEMLERALSSIGGKFTWWAQKKLCHICICSVVLMALCLMLVCFPGYEGKDGEFRRLPMAQACAKLREVNDWNGRKTSYHSDERAFVQKALHALPEGAVVLNIPYDGSGYSYGLDGMNVFFRTNNTRGRMDEGKDIVLQRLDEVANDPQIAKYLSEMNIEYVLQLDQGMKRSSSIASVFRFTQYSKDKTSIYSQDYWRGMVNLNDDTEGFEVVLSEGDMRLYRIACLDQQEQ